ncbi:antitoxin Xre/MbcA/ParS toxin-binding domain-containing protein [Pseudomonas sp. HY13-MNA-CIBAN-0226]|uniref:antitoxin Xre/MbcA/ParS toxin-binding domain-containing protein n=1 Tax=Pseudomonas sp. HY13-MNA-CIBAN-0226 TaxID=3140473 RepID=UPI0033247C26
MSVRTFARRRKAGRFSPMESDCLMALITVFQASLDLFEGDASAATEWMQSPARGHGSLRPIDMVRTRVETNAVVDLIGRLERGVLA